jgi:ParB family chromosome partitioning protein
MADDDAFVAQGVENNERQDLSYVERAIFARRLSEAGVEMKAIVRALGTSRPNVVTMLGFARSLPVDLLMAIGRSPGIGRPRWEKFKAVFDAAIANLGAEGAERVWRGLVSSPEFASLDPAGRIDALSHRLVEQKPPQAVSREIKDDDGGVVARIAKSPSGDGRWLFRREADLSFREDGKSFSDWLEERLNALHRDWKLGM